MYDFLLLTYSNFVRKMHRFWKFKNALTLKSKSGLGVREGH